jgi:FkbM family methyltransferase
MLSDNLKAVSSVLKLIWTDPSNEGERAYRTLLSLGWQVLKRTTTLPIIIRLDNGLSFVADPKLPHSTAVIYTRIYESRYIEFARAHVTRGGAMIDVGAHAGLYTLLLANLFERAYCFEPSKEIFPYLERNLAYNRLEPNFRAYNAAISSRTGDGTLLSQGALRGTAALAQDLNGSASSADGHPVSLRTLDSLIDQETLPRVTFIKIDTEGQMSVLHGAQTLLARNPGALVQFERQNCFDLDDFSRFFDRAGWKMFGVAGNGSPSTNRTLMNVAYNLFACGPEHPLATLVEPRP